MSEFTPGDWEIVESRDVFCAIISPGVATICIDVENEADARLVKASKRMYAAIKKRAEAIKTYCAQWGFAGDNKIASLQAELAELEAIIAAVEGE